MPLKYKSWKTLEKLLKANTPYSFDIYDNLENYFRRAGASGLADEVFIAGKRRERKEVMDWWSPSRFFSWILDLTVGYGRHPSYALFISLVFILFGCWVFRRERMVPENYKEERDADGNLLEPMAGKPASQGKHPYHPLWFSLDVFLPIIDLWADKYWMPRRADKWRWVYMVAHKFSGWVLVPIGLAAFSGIIK